MNWSAGIIAILFFIGQNNYFGWNARPQSPEELICDGIVLVLVALFLGR